MYEPLRAAAMRGLEDRKRAVSERLRQAATRARDLSAGGSGGGSAVGAATAWVATRLDDGARAIDGRDVEDVLRDVRDAAYRHPAATLAVTAATAFLVTRLAMPAWNAVVDDQGTGTEGR